MKKRSMNVLEFKALIEQDEDGWFVASVPELPGCHTQGKTLEQVRSRIKEVIQLVLDADPDTRKEKLASPAATPRFFGIEDIRVSYA